jgi:hypothetical protein
MCNGDGEMDGTCPSCGTVDDLIKLKEECEAQYARAQKAESDYSFLCDRLEALIGTWRYEVGRTANLNRATVDFSTWGCVRYADAQRRCADDLEKEVTGWQEKLPVGKEPQP